MAVAALACLSALVATSGGASRAQTVAEPAEVVSQTSGGGPYSNDNRQSSISANGRFVEFDSSPQREVVARDRVGNTTGRAPTVPGLTGSISDNGCVIAYTNGTPTNVGQGSFYVVMAFDRCTGVDLPVGTAFIVGGSQPPQPKPNRNGSVIVWSSGTTIEHATRSGDVYTQGAPIVFPNELLGPRVAVSDDGNLIAFERRFGSVALVDRTAPGSFEVISVDETGAALNTAFDPSISGDGSLVTFTVPFTDNVNGILLRDRNNGVTRAIAAPADDGEISRDGEYVAFTLDIGEIGEIYVARSTSALPFATLELDLVSYRDGDPATGTGGSASNPAISSHGRWVSFDSYAANLLVPGQGFDDGTHVYVRQRRPAVRVDSIDYGTVGGPVNGQSTVTSVGLAGFDITSIEASGDFTVVGEDCPNILQPGASCTVTVRFDASAAGQATGVLSVRDDSYPTVPLVGTGRLIAVFDPGVPPRPTTTTTTPPGRPGLAITPDPVLFDAVVVGTPSAQRTATVSNTGEVSITVNTVSLSGAAAGDFTVVSDSCTGTTLAEGDSCPLELGFTASQAGSRVATITATGSGSTSASAELRGSGRFDAVLTVTPEVAAGGQVVTVMGDGYPASTSVEIALAEAPPVAVVTDANGRFMLPWLILSGTPQGELLADDVAVVGSYDAEPAPLLVVNTPMRPQATATLSRNARSYVSR